jgi:hypothetical protein
MSFGGGYFEATLILLHSSPFSILTAAHVVKSRQTFSFFF